MDLREYLAIRRAYNLVRQRIAAKERLTFAELAILCRMKVLERPMNTSEIADYQSALRPTMTHRAKHLSARGLIKRTKGSTDRRNVSCELTEAGQLYVDETCATICEVLRTGPDAMRMTARRAYRMVDAMGSLSIISGDLVLLGISLGEGQSCTISRLVSISGLLQPTVSMSAASLVREGMAKRVYSEESGSRSSGLALTEEGAAKVQEMSERIAEIVVRR